MDTGTLVVGLLVAVVGVFSIGYWLMNARLGTNTTKNERTSGAIETLKERYVDGEIDTVEYEQRLETLYEDEANPSVAETRTSNSRQEATSSRADDEGSVDRRTSDERSPRRNRKTCGPGRKSGRRSKKRSCR